PTPRASARKRALSGRVAGWREDVRLFRRLFRYARPYRLLLILSWAGTLGYAISGALLAYMVKPIFDDVLIRSIDVGRVAFTIVALYIIKGLCSYFSTTLVGAAGQRAVTDLRNALYEHVLKQSFTFLSRNSTGSLMSHITTDVEKIQSAVS